MSLSVFCGGDLETNAYFLKSAKGVLCFDAPEGTLEELVEKGLQVEALILTHGHFDHIWDAAAIQKHFGCPVWIHEKDAFMVEDPKVFSMWGIPPILPVTNPSRLPVKEKGSAEWSCGGIAFSLFHIPGHSPGSVAFYDIPNARVIGGDILFAGGVGRWDLPGGNQKELISGIRDHLLPLPEGVKVYPGHGPATTIGHEKKTNPYL
jgi:glyoxylase-like metal-dependent hydrolase (beta-lactamase superfamily II)